MPRWVKMFIGLLLLPACAGAAIALWQVIRASGKADTVWVAGMAGFACWLVIYLLLPRPMWVYVVGHEFTHALWTWAMGGRVRKFKISSSGGHVVVTKNNFLIALAPYFFPLYGALVVLAFVAAGFFWDLRQHAAWFHLLLGASYSFHITLTLHALKQEQSDVTSQGWLFSVVIIFLGNMLVLLLGIPLVTGEVTVVQALGMWWEATLEVVGGVKNLKP